MMAPLCWLVSMLLLCCTAIHECWWGWTLKSLSSKQSNATKVTKPPTLTTQQPVILSSNSYSLFYHSIFYFSFCFVVLQLTSIFGFQFPFVNWITCKIFIYLFSKWVLMDLLNCTIWTQTFIRLSWGCAFSFANMQR